MDTFITKYGLNLLSQTDFVHCSARQKKENFMKEKENSIETI